MNKKYIWYGVIGIVLCVSSIGVYLYVARSTVSPEDVTMRFYETWHVARSGGDTWAPLRRGIHTKSTHISESFARSIDRAYERGVDIVWCESGEVGEVVVRDVRTNEGRVTSRVDVALGDSEVSVFLVQDARGWWRIDEVDCVSGVNPVRDISHLNIGE